MTKSILSVVAIVAAFGSVNCLDLEAEVNRQKEVPFCGAIQPAPHVDSSWIRSTDVWYFVYWTKLEILLTSKAFLDDEEFTNMTEDKAIKDICFRMNFNTGDSTGHGKHLPSNFTSMIKIHYNPIRHGVIDWECVDHYVQTTYIIMTDNKTFAVGVDVFPDGTRGGFVMTTDTDESKFSETQVAEWRKKFVEVGLEEGDFIHTPLECNKELDENTKMIKDIKDEGEYGNNLEGNHSIESDTIAATAS